MLPTRRHEVLSRLCPPSGPMRGREGQMLNGSVIPGDPQSLQAALMPIDMPPTGEERLDALLAATAVRASDAEGSITVTGGGPPSGAGAADMRPVLRLQQGLMTLRVLWGTPVAAIRFWLFFFNACGLRESPDFHYERLHPHLRRLCSLCRPFKGCPLLGSEAARATMTTGALMPLRTGAVSAAELQGRPLLAERLCAAAAWLILRSVYAHMPHEMLATLGTYLLVEYRNLCTHLDMGSHLFSEPEDAYAPLALVGYESFGLREVHKALTERRTYYYKTVRTALHQVAAVVQGERLMLEGLARDLHAIVCGLDNDEPRSSFLCTPAPFEGLSWRVVRLRAYRDVSEVATELLVRRHDPEGAVEVLDAAAANDLRAYRLGADPVSATYGLPPLPTVERPVFLQWPHFADGANLGTLVLAEDGVMDYVRLWRLCRSILTREAGGGNVAAYRQTCLRDFALSFADTMRREGPRGADFERLVHFTMLWSFRPLDDGTKAVLLATSAGDHAPALSGLLYTLSRTARSATLKPDERLTLFAALKSLWTATLSDDEVELCNGDRVQGREALLGACAGLMQESSLRNIQACIVSRAEVDPRMLDLCARNAVPPGGVARELVAWLGHSDLTQLWPGAQPTTVRLALVLYAALMFGHRLPGGGGLALETGANSYYVASFDDRVRPRNGSPLLRAACTAYPGPESIKNMFK